MQLFLLILGPSATVLLPVLAGSVRG